MKQLLKNSPSLFYKGSFVVTLLLLLLFFVPSIIYGTEEQQRDTPVSENFDLRMGNMSFRLVERAHNPLTGYMEFLLESDREVPRLSEIQMVAGEMATSQVLESNVIPLTNYFTILQVFDVPSNFTQVLVDFGVVSSQTNQRVLDVSQLFANNRGAQAIDETVNVQQTSFFANRAQIEQDELLRPQTEHNYFLHVAEMEIERIETFIETNDNAITLWEEQIETLEEEIAEEAQAQTYMTQTALQQSNIRLSSLQNMIRTNELNIDQAELANEELQERISLLRLRMGN